jgi:hypothetical protein
VTIEDSGERPDMAMTTDRINNNYVQSNPKADIFGDAIYIRPIPSTSVSLGLRLWYIARPTDISAMNSTFGLPIDYQGYLAYGVSSDICARKLDMAASTAFLAKYEDGLRKMEVEYPPINLDYQLGFFPPPINYV